MIPHLILNTLMACQPKVPSTTTVQGVASSEPQDESMGLEAAKPTWPPTVPQPVGLENLPSVEPTSIPLRRFSSPVLLSDLSYYDLSIYNQFEINPKQLVCEEICAQNPELTSYDRLTNVENCQMDLIENWRAVVGSVQHQGREALLPQLDVQVGVVQCTADITVIIFGRAATTPVMVQEMNDDWGGYFAKMALEEATAVCAFEELLAHLQRWEAPDSLQDWCAQIIQDEQRHTLMMSGLAHRNGQESAVVQFPERNSVSLKEMTLHNALTGCIGETWSAVNLRHQALHASKYNAVFERIAQDETNHAEFSWELHDWLMSRLTDSERAEVVIAMKEMLGTVPSSKSDNAVSMGDMDTDTLERSWGVFARQVEAIVDGQRVA